MPEQQFSPLNALEVALVAAACGNAPLEEFLKLFLSSRVVVPSGTEVLPDGTGMMPVLYDKEGTQMVAVFTDLERARRVAHLASYCLEMNGADFLTRVCPEYGVVVNPGYSKGFDLSTEGIRNILRDFGPDSTERS